MPLGSMSSEDVISDCIKGIRMCRTFEAAYETHFSLRSRLGGGVRRILLSGSRVR